MYLITRLGTIIRLVYDLHKKVVTGVKVSTYVKNILGAFPITQLKIAVGPTHMQLAMLVEQDCICVVQASSPPTLGPATTGLIDMLNENDSLPLAYGLQQTDITGVDQLKVNQYALDNQGVVVANSEMIEVFRTRLVQMDAE